MSMENFEHALQKFHPASRLVQTTDGLKWKPCVIEYDGDKPLETIDLIGLYNDSLSASQEAEKQIMKTAYKAVQKIEDNRTEAVENMLVAFGKLIQQHFCGNPSKITQVEALEVYNTAKKYI